VLKRLSLSGLILVIALAGAPVVKAKDKEKEAPGQMVDSGSFSVMKSGRRVATEKFSIQRSSSGSTITSQLDAEADLENAKQNSELRLTPSGDLIRYEWHDVAPGKADLVVMPNDQFLIEKVTTPPSTKAAEQPFLMPTSTMILDNNSFVQREVLAWRYLASSCKQEGGKTLCPTEAAQFGVLVPQDRMSMKVSVEPVGMEKVKINGAERQLLRLHLKDDSGDWMLWLDDQNSFKLVRIVINGDNTEILRD
jgi:hypothetical protein